MAYISPWSTDDETDFQQTRSRFERDYWAPDRDDVLRRLGEYNPNGPFADRGTFDTEMQRRAQLGATRPRLSSEQLGDLWNLGGGGSERDPNQIYMRSGAYLGSDDWWKRWGAPMGTGSGTGTPTPRQAQGAPTGSGGNFGTSWLGSGLRTLDDFRRFVDEWNKANPSDLVTLGGSKGDKATYRGRTYDAVIAAGLGGQGASWSDITDGGGGGNVFSDPATREWEALLRQLVKRLNQPQPTWTAAQRELQQTQVLDPLERQRQTQRQQMTQRLAERGLTPGSGVFESAMADIDRQFNQLRTQTQGAFANKAIEREDQVFQGNEARALNALNLFQRIPQLADQRYAMARGSLMDANPYGLLGLQQRFEEDQARRQQYQDYQNQQFWAQIAQILGQWF